MTRDDAAAENRAKLSSGRLLARNTGLNIAAQMTRLISGFISVPFVVAGLGVARFGVLTLAWFVFNYAGSLLSMGLGRAVTQLTAEKLGSGREDEIPGVFWTGIAMTFGVGVVGALIVAGVTPLLIDDVLKVPEELERETVLAFFVLAVGVPFVISGTGILGSLQAHQRFDLINAVAIPVTMLTYLGPVAILQYYPNLIAVVGVIVCARILAWTANFVQYLRITPGLRRNIHFNRDEARSLLRIGRWVLSASIVYPLMVTFDRFVLGATVSVAAVAYYAAPYELVTKLWVVSFAIAPVLFSALALNMRTDKARARRLADRGVRVIFACLFPMALVTVTLAYEGLELYLGRAFAENGEFVAQVLVVGVLIQGTAQVATSVVMSGRPDWIAKLGAVQLPFYLVALLLTTREWGIEGAAVTWAVRATFDSSVLLVLSRRLLESTAPISKRLVAAGASALLVLLAGALVSGLAVKFAFLALALSVFAVFAWTVLLGPAERAAVVGRLGRRRVRAA